MKKNVLVGQSGGPTAVINASLYGVITESLKHDEEIDTVYGMVNGIEGFLADHYLDLSHTLGSRELELLKLTQPLLPGVSSLPPPASAVSPSCCRADCLNLPAEHPFLLTMSAPVSAG